MKTSAAHSAQTCFDFAPEFERPARLSDNARRVLEVIEGYSKGAWGFCAAFQRTLAGVLKRSVRWVASAVAELKRYGAISVQLRGPHAAAYRVQKDVVAELCISFPVPSFMYESAKSTERAPRKPAPLAPRKPPKMTYEERLADWARLIDEAEAEREAKNKRRIA